MHRFLKEKSDFIERVLFSVSAKILFLTSGLTFLTALLIGGFYYTQTAKSTLEAELNKLAFETRAMAPQFKAAFNELKNDVLVVSKMPPIQGFIRSTRNNDIDPVDGATTELWRTRLETIFASIIGPKPYYVQMRYIGVADNGRELVRVNRGRNDIIKIPPEGLQEKGGEPYFKEAKNLSPGSIYYSLVSLNKEHGKVQKPYLPVIRAIIPVHDENQELFGMIVINVAYDKLLANTLTQLEISEDLYIVNEAGDYITYTKEGKDAEFKFRETSKTESEHPVLAAIQNSGKKDSTHFIDIGNEEYALHYHKVFFDAENKDRYLALALTIPKEVLLEATYKTRFQSLLLAGALVLASVVCAAFMANFLRKPLQQMIEGVRSYGDNEGQISLPTKRRDEIGELAMAFDALIKKLNNSREAERQLLVRLQAVLDNTVDGLITIDEQGTIQHYNKACEKIFGYSSDEAVGENVKMLMPEPYQGEHDGYLENYHETGEKKVIGIGREVEGKRKDGGIFPLDLSVSEVTVRGQKLFSGIVRDISEEQETQRRLAAILDNTVDGLITIDEKGLIQHYNKACEKIFGYTPEEVLGKNIKMLMPEPYHEEHDGYLKSYHRGGDRKIIGIGREVEAKRKDGSIFPIDLSVSEVKVQGKKLYSGIIRDITDRKKAEEEIMRSNEELERFAYIASHDLQEPLRMVSNFTALLDEEYGESMDEQARQYMKFTMDASSRMQDLVSDLLEYSRVGSEEAGFSEFDSTIQVDGALKNLEEAIKETNAEITYDSFPAIYANPVRFSRLIQNLIGNGIKYRAKDRAPKIHIGVEEREEDWLFTVRDNGIGIKEEYLNQIFVIFKRLHNKQEYSGTGIGLAVCKKIVESFGGELWAESEFEKGSTFFFTVPKQEKLRSAT